ncbi:MAG: MFS transporter [Candidatus Binatia bacterium]
MHDRFRWIILALVSVSHIIGAAAQYGINTLAPLYLKEAMGLSAYWASQALALTQIGGMVGRIGWGVMSDRLFQGGRKIVLVLIGALSVALTLGLAFVPPGTSLLILLLVIRGSLTP